MGRNQNDIVLEAAGQLGEDVVIWNLDSGDSMGAAPDESKARYNQAAQGNAPILALNHETHESSVKGVLPAAIQTLQGSGCRLVTVAECTGKEPYFEVGCSSTYSLQFELRLSQRDGLNYAGVHRW